MRVDKGRGIITSLVYPACVVLYWQLCDYSLLSIEVISALSSFTDLRKGVGKVLYRIIMQCFKRGWSTGTSPPPKVDKTLGWSLMCLSGRSRVRVHVCLFVCPEFDRLQPLQHRKVQVQAYVEIARTVDPEGITSCCRRYTPPISA